MERRLSSILLSLCLALSLVPAAAFAEEGASGEAPAVQESPAAREVVASQDADAAQDTAVLQEAATAQDAVAQGPAAAAQEGEAAREVGSAVDLRGALESGTESTVRLAEDITIEARLDIARDVTVDLNGYVLRYDETAEPDSIFRVTGGKTLAMTDSRPGATHEDAKLPAGGLITGGRGYRYDGGAGLTYYYYGGGVYVEAGASFELAGGTIYDCGVRSGATYAYGGGIYCMGGSVTIRGGAIRSCALSAEYNTNGGGIYLGRGINDSSYPSLTMTGGVIADCSANSGGGICAAPGVVRITGGSIENCTATKRGGGLLVGGHAGDQVSVLDAAISGCEAKYGGGVALIGYAELELGENARITGCTASEKDDAEEGTIEYGAAIYMDIEDTYTVNYPGCFLYANGGRVEGSVYVEGNRHNQLATIKSTNAIDHTDGKPSTVFTGDVYCEGDIRGGSFYGSVTAAIPYSLDFDDCKNFWSNISGGSFYGPVRTEGYVSGGTFYGGLNMEKNAKLNGRPIQTTGEPGPTTNIPDPNGEPVTVTYEYGELGGTYAEQIVQTGETAIQPTDPKVNGFTFCGWYTDAACTDGNEYDFTATVTADITLYAKWEGTYYGIRITDTDGNAVYVTSKNANDVLGDGTVSYTPGYIEEGKDLDDFTAEDLNKMLRGETVEGIRLPKLTLNGASFKQLAAENWGDDSTTRQLDLLLQLELIGDNTIAYDETYLAEGAVYSKNVWALYITGNGTLKVTAPAENGWGLSGDWALYRQESGTVTIQAGDCGIGYDTWGSLNLTFHGGKLTIEAGNDPKDYGVFNSWYDLSESCDISESATFLVGDSAENYISLTAPYTIDSIRQELDDAYEDGTLTHDPWYLSLTANYTVAFDTDGGSTVDPQTVPYGETAKTPAVPTKSGYTFAGWYLDGKTYDFTAPVTENLTLTAKWTACEQDERIVRFDDAEPPKTDGAELPKTGDSSNLAMWVALLLVSGGSFAGAAAAARRKKHGR